MSGVSFVYVLVDATPKLVLDTFIEKQTYGKK